VIGSSLVLFALRARHLASGGVFAPISREGALVLNNILLCSICTVVVTGTMYPLFAELVFGAKLSVGAPFFNATVLPLVIPLGAAMSIGPVLSWKRANLGAALMRLWYAALVALCVGLFSAWGWGALPALAFGGSAWLIAGAAAELIERTQLFHGPLANFRSRAGGLRRAALGTALAHAGLGVTIAGIAGMSLSSNVITALKVGQTAHLAGYDWTLVSLVDAPGPNFESRVATISLSADNQPIAILAPERHFFPLQNQTVSDVAIRTNGFRDLYAVLGEERDGAAVLRLHYNPLAPWIWLGALIMAAGGALSLSDRRLRLGAPAPRRAPSAAMAAE